MCTGGNQTCTWHAVPWYLACSFSGLVPSMQCLHPACALDETKHVLGMQCHGTWYVLFLDLYPACSACTQHVHWMKPNMYVACSAMVPGMFIFWVIRAKYTSTVLRDSHYKELAEYHDTHAFCWCGTKYSTTLLLYYSSTLLLYYSSTPLLYNPFYSTSLILFYSGSHRGTGFGSRIRLGMRAKTEKSNFLRNILNSFLLDGACKLLISLYEFNSLRTSNFQGILIKIFVMIYNTFIHSF